jgi:SAM-dependent methyltransferase
LTDTKDMMRRDWDERAKRDAFLYIASWRSDWDEKSFFESGEEDYLRLVQPVLEKLAFNPSDKSMAELGCGAGRMTRSFARRFRAVSAVDISAEMQAKAKEYLRDFPNVRWVLSDGETLAGIESSSVHFTFSYLVLQHMPNAQVVAGAIREMLRILRPGGNFLFQFNGSDRPTMNWKGRAISSVLDSLATMGFKRLSQGGARMAGIDPEMVGKTWRGAALTAAQVSAIVREGGGEPDGFIGEATPLAWCYGHKV